MRRCMVEMTASNRFNPGRPMMVLHVEGKQTTMKVMKTILYRGEVPAMIGRVIFSLTSTESLLKTTKDAEIGLRQLKGMFI